MLATGGFGVRFAARARPPLRAAPWSDGGGLAVGRARGAALSAGQDEFYGRAMPATARRVGEADFVARRSSTAAGGLSRTTTGTSLRGRPVSARERPRPGARAGAVGRLVVDDRHLGEGVRERTVGAMITVAEELGADVRRGRRDDGGPGRRRGHAHARRPAGRYEARVLDERGARCRASTRRALTRAGSSRAVTAVGSPPRSCSASPPRTSSASGQAGWRYAQRRRSPGSGDAADLRDPEALLLVLDHLADPGRSPPARAARSRSARCEHEVAAVAVRGVAVHRPRILRLAGRVRRQQHVDRVPPPSAARPRRAPFSARARSPRSPASPPPLAEPSSTIARLHPSPPGSTTATGSAARGGSPG